MLYFAPFWSTLIYSHRIFPPSAAILRSILIYLALIYSHLLYSALLYSVLLYFAQLCSALLCSVLLHLKLSFPSPPPSGDPSCRFLHSSHFHQPFLFIPTFALVAIWFSPIKYSTCPNASRDGRPCWSRRIKEEDPSATAVRIFRFVVLLCKRDFWNDDS